jgi:ribosome-binding protein aMBF1 (putative translation factor)
VDLETRSTTGVPSVTHRKTVVIPVIVGTNYMEELIERLRKHGVSQGELAREMGVNPTVITRWKNSTSEITGKPMMPRMENVMKIEAALHEILKRKAREKKRR